MSGNITQIVAVTLRHEWDPVQLFYHPLSSSMRIHAKVVLLSVCFGVFLLLYFLRGNAVEDPLSIAAVDGEEELSESFPSASEFTRNVGAKFTTKAAARDKKALKKREKSTSKGRRSDIKAR